MISKSVELASHPGKSYRRGLAAQKCPLTPTSLTSSHSAASGVWFPESASASSSMLDTHAGGESEQDVYLEDLYMSGDYQLGYSRPPSPTQFENKVPTPSDPVHSSTLRGSRHLGRLRSFLNAPKKERL
eukprot:Gregarina_sp_Pseudo_9__5728@NODE_833_length_2150_cov_176_531975_g781_i0_p2_GENE_NODE_833_length_2150_cov_176_531975_g781_i0NODE_833_length_2150_cov_176_531975_g781_i0_p2_ORF_typecomplete_len129_score18_70_NODE_833_length_2150_cov_176_531975_g781_i017082094